MSDGREKRGRGRAHPADCNFIGGYNYINYIFHQQCLSSRAVNEEAKLLTFVFAFLVSPLSPSSSSSSSIFFFVVVLLGARGGEVPEEELC